MKIHFKKFLLSGLVIIVFIFYAFYERTGNNTSAQISTPVASGNNPAPATPPVYKDGEYTGALVDAYYGNVQVKAVISGGKISDVVFLSYPQDRRTSVMINTQATPILKSEALTAQSANVDVVSGATYTSYGFTSSLSSALAQAS